MARIKIIQIQGTVPEPIVNVSDKIRLAVSDACYGVDDMHMLGSKALVLRAEVFQQKLLGLYESLTKIGVKLNKQGLPNIESLQAEIEYPLAIQIVSLCDDTGHRTSLPDIPL